MQDEWNVSETAIAVGITTFTCGFGIAPMVLAPFSEINGRRPIFVVTGVLFVIFQLICAVTPTYAGMLVSRFLAGCCSSTFSTMVGGVVSDIYHAEERNTAMALFSGSALFGTGLGPIISGVVAQHTTWRWIFYLQVITCGVMMVFIIFFFKETRGSVLLSKKAKALNKWMAQLESEGHHGFMMPISSTTTTTTTTKPVSPTAPQRIRWKVKSDEERTSLGRMIGISLYRPFHLLFTESVVFFFSLWISFSWAVLYLTFSAIPLVFTTSHDFSLQQNGAVFTAISVAAVISTCISVAQEHIARKYFTGKQRAIFDGPEGRLYFACIQSALLPIGCFWFGWTSFPSNHWILPALGIGCSTMGIFSIYLAVFNYLADTYHRYASSALAAQSFCRNILAGAFPLFTPQMFKVMTFQGAGSFLGGMGALLTIVPWVLVFYGPRIRARSKFAREIMD
jgi:multidrug resistance protein